MKIAAVRHCPILGGRLRSTDERTARRVLDVHDVLRNDNAVAVTASPTGPQRRLSDALRIERY
jgi:isoquinoline 1-oxidoreductase beta subunit